MHASSKTMQDALKRSMDMREIRGAKGDNALSQGENLEIIGCCRRKT